MHPDALVQAIEWLSRAEIAYQALRAPADYEAGERAWSDYLIASATAYDKLQAGSRTSQKSMSWQLSVSIDRKRDPLLRYLRIARNSHVHDYLPILDRTRAGYDQEFETPGGKTYVLSLTWDRRPEGADEDMSYSVGEPDDGSKMIGPPVKSFVNGLLPVIDQNGKVVGIPTIHSGKPIGNSRPAELARLGLDHLREAIAAAGQLDPVR